MTAADNKQHSNGDRLQPDERSYKDQLDERSFDGEQQRTGGHPFPTAVVHAEEEDGSDDAEDDGSRLPERTGVVAGNTPSKTSIDARR